MLLDDLSAVYHFVAQMALNFVEDKFDIVVDIENIVDTVENIEDLVPEVNVAKSEENAFCLTNFSVEFSLVDGAQTYIVKCDVVMWSDVIVQTNVVVWSKEDALGTSFFVEFSSV